MTEQRIQYEICMYLQSIGVYFFSIPLEATKGKGNYKATGMRPGVSDLVIVLPGRVIFVEVKNEVGTQRKSQELFQRRVEELGHLYVLVRSVEDVKKVLTSLA